MPSRRSGRDTQTLSAAVTSALLPAPLIGWAWSLRSPVRR